MIQYPLLDINDVPSYVSIVNSYEALGELHREEISLVLFPRPENRNISNFLSSIPGGVPAVWDNEADYENRLEEAFKPFENLTGYNEFLKHELVVLEAFKKVNRGGHYVTNFNVVSGPQKEGVFHRDSCPLVKVETLVGNGTLFYINKNDRRGVELERSVEWRKDHTRIYRIGQNWLGIFKGTDILTEVFSVFHSPPAVDAGSIRIMSGAGGYMK